MKILVLVSQHCYFCFSNEVFICFYRFAWLHKLPIGFSKTWFLTNHNLSLRQLESETSFYWHRKNFSSKIFTFSFLAKFSMRMYQKYFLNIELSDWKLLIIKRKKKTTSIDKKWITKFQSRKKDLILDVWFYQQLQNM